MVIAPLYPFLYRLAEPKARWIIIGLHLLLLIAIGMQQGILVDKEALKYTGCARAVLQGDFGDLTGNYLKYAGYILFLLPFVALDSLWLAVVTQIIVGVVAAERLARYSERITGNVALGRIAMALFLLCPLIQTWTLALYTEHFFTCMVIIYLERMDRVRKFDGLSLVLSAIVLLSRPVGMFFVIPALVWKWTNGHTLRHQILTATVCGLALLVAAVFIPRIEHAQLAPIATGQVIAGIGGTDATNFTGSTIAHAHHQLLNRVGVSEWCSITVRRIASLFTLTRPYYSAPHNIANALFFLLYPLAVLGIVRHRSNAHLRPLVTILVLNIAIVGLTHDEWSGRFMVPLLPIIIVLATMGLKPRHVDHAGRLR